MSIIASFRAPKRVKPASELTFAKHMGPGPHPSGSPQSDHGRGGRIAPNRGDVTRSKVKQPSFLTHEGEVAVGGPVEELKGTDVPLAEFDAATAPPVGTHSLPEKVVRSLLVNKLGLYEVTPGDLHANIGGLAERAAALYEELDAGGGGSLEDIPEWVTESDYDSIRDQLVTIDGDSWEWTDNAGDVLREWDRFYLRWNEDLSAVAADTGIEFQRVVALSSAISPNLDANLNLAYAKEISSMIAANPVLTDEQVEVVNALLERQKVGEFRFESGDRLLDAPDGQVMARTGHIIRASDEQWRIANPENAKGFGVGRTWDNFAKGFGIASGQLSVDDSVIGIKTRSFINNIMDPNNLSGADDVTVDFQTIDLAFRLTGSGAITDITSSGAYNGIDLGVRPIVGELIRRQVFEPDGSLTQVAQRTNSTHSLHMQEILWAQFKRELGAGQQKGQGAEAGSIGSFWRDENPLFDEGSAPDRPNKWGKPRSIPDWVRANKDEWKTTLKVQRMAIEEELWNEYKTIIGF